MAFGDVEKNKKLIEEYPFLQIRDVWTGELPDNPYEYTWLDDMPTAWRETFGLDLCKDLKEVLIKGNYLNDYQILQVKEKFGELRWYAGGIPEEIYKEYTDILNKYEELSMNTCIRCGKPSTHMTRGYILPLCDECDNNEW